MNHISIEEFLKLSKTFSPTIIDIRSKVQYTLGNIPTAINIPGEILLSNPSKYLSKEKTYYLYCQSGHISQEVSNRLNRQGYTTVNIDGGYNNYLLRK